MYVIVRVSSHDFFKREGNNVIFSMNINVAQAALGAALRVPTLTGEVELDIPAGTQTGQSIRLKDKGIPYIRSQRRGDQIVNVTVKTPKALSESQTALFQQLAESFSETEEFEDDKSILGKIKDAFSGE